MARRKPVVADPGLQLLHLLREAFGSVAVRVEQLRGAAVAAGRAAQAQLDSPGCQRVQHAELLSDFEWCVMRQHHPGAAQPDAGRARGNRGQENFRGGACNAGQIVVLADPKTVVTPVLAALRQGQRVADSSVLRMPVRRHGLIEHREFQHGLIIG